MWEVKSIISRIFFAPASQVLNDSQQETIINYSEDGKIFQIPVQKTTFWQRIGTSNI